MLKRQYWWDLTHLQHRSLVATLTLQAILVVGVVAAVPWVVRRFGWGAGALVVCMVLLPALGSRDFQGSGRYLLGAFPALIVVGERLSQRRLTPWWCGVSAVVLAVLAAGFAHGMYLA